MDDMKLLLLVEYFIKETSDFKDKTSLENITIKELTEITLKYTSENSDLMLKLKNMDLVSYCNLPESTKESFNDLVKYAVTLQEKILNSLNFLEKYGGK